ncbi:MAG: hypothetical protein HGA78_00045 [Nitrospirales bacterium]|nr:hypothetical protein [Nitrospirales bacterium]
MEIPLEQELYFSSRRNIGREVDEIKKIIVETKETLRESTMPGNSTEAHMVKAIKQHLDIERISHQVYQNLERRIRTERERRGF